MWQRLDIRNLRRTPWKGMCQSQEAFLGTQTLDAVSSHRVGVDWDRFATGSGSKAWSLSLGASSAGKAGVVCQSLMR